MNCGICYAALREKNTCPGCRGDNESKPNSCFRCKILNCPELIKHGHKYCFSCKSYPCKNLKSLDKRYRTKYHMSMIENLDSIKKNGIRKFIAQETTRWTCKHCGGTINVHKAKCSLCEEELTF